MFIHQKEKNHSFFSYVTCHASHTNHKRRVRLKMPHLCTLAFTSQLVLHYIPYFPLPYFISTAITGSYFSLLYENVNSSGVKYSSFLYLWWQCRVVIQLIFAMWLNLWLIAPQWICYLNQVINDRLIKHFQSVFLNFLKCRFFSQQYLNVMNLPDSFLE